MERKAREFEKPKSPEHRDAYLALTLYCTKLANDNCPEVQEGQPTRDVILDSETAELTIELPVSQLEEVFTNLSRIATTDDGTHAPITYYAQTQDEIWRKREYRSHEEVMAEWDARGVSSLVEVIGSFENVYGPAIEPAEVFQLIIELQSATVEA